MLFNSFEFLFVFFPLTVILTWLVYNRLGSKGAIPLLVLLSLCFYSYWNPPFVLLILLSICINYLVGWLLFNKKRFRKLIFVLSISFNLSLILYFKYFNYIISVVNDLFSLTISIDNRIFLPLGISFFTFQQIAFCHSIFKRKMEFPKISDYFLFVSFFPQLIAGPIVHPEHIIPQFKSKKAFSINTNLFVIGLSIFIVGLFKKMIIADNISVFSKVIFDRAFANGNVFFWEAWTGAFCYTFQLYFDFSGYSDMAIGLGTIFGISLPVNFNSPYKALNASDFWRRWHITLSSFLRDYLYIPFGGSRYGNLLRYRNLMFTMIIGGMWHGAGNVFLIWGAFHGLLLCINHGYRLFKSRYIGKIEERFQKYFIEFSKVLTFLSVTIGWVIFNSQNWEHAKFLIRSMIKVWSQPVYLPIGSFAEFIPFVSSDARSFGLNIGSYFELGRFGTSDYLIACILLYIVCRFFPNTNELFGIIEGNKHKFLFNKKWALILSFAFTLCLISLTKVSEFLYFQF